MIQSAVDLNLAMGALVSEFSIALNVGGESVRMGSDKGLVAFLGQPLYRYILNQVDDLSDDVFLITNQPKGYNDFPGRIVADKIPGIGALGGIHTALSYAKNDWCLVLASDMPFISKQLIEYQRAQTPGADVVIPSLGPDKLEPFRAFYQRSCLEPIKQAIEAGERRAVSFLSQVQVQVVPRLILEDLDPALDTFQNINTPQDLERVQDYARSREG